MKSAESNNSLTTIFISILGLVLLGVLIFLSHSVISPIFLYILILIFFLLNKNVVMVRNVFVLSSIIFIVWILNELMIVLTPFLISLFLAYLLNPIVVYLEKRKLPRWLGTLILILLVLVFIGSFVAFFVPPLINQIGLLISSAPQRIAQLSEFFNEKILPELNRIGIIYPDLQKFILNELPARLQNLLNGIFKNILSIFSGVSFVFNQIINLVIIPIMTFYFLRDFNLILEKLLRLFNESSQKKVIHFTNLFDKIFGNYIRGFLTVSLINGTVITTGLTLIGVPYSVVLGLLSALLNFVPYFGVIISFALGFLISLLSGIEGLRLILIPILYFGENLIENSVIVPKVIGEKVGLHPLLVLLAIFVFGHFGGILGMLISVPVTALLIFSFVEKENERELSSQ
jgi:predicted PurR-regulated permease PerM